MELITLRCNHCGAPLQVGKSARYLTCQFCQAQLEVRHTDSAAFTEVLRDVADKTTQMAGNLKVIELQNEVERLDREWQHRHQTGAKNPQDIPWPVRIIQIVFLLLFTGVGLFFGSVAPGGAFGFVFGAVGYGFAVIGILMIIFLLTAKGSGAEGSPATSYQQRRASLLQEIESLRQDRAS